MPALNFMRRGDGRQRDAAGRGVLTSGHALRRAHRAGAARGVLDGQFPAFDGAAHQHFVEHRGAAGPDLLHEREVRQLEAGRIRRSQGWNDDIRIGPLPLTVTLPRAKDIAQTRNSDEAYLEISKGGML
jgi:hypothetical protein